MKKLILPLLLLLTISILAAVESDPSAVVGYVKYDLVAGNNLVALPMECEWDWASELGDTFAGNVDQIYYWDVDSQSFFGATDIGGFWDGDFAIDTNHVLMVYSNAPAALYSLGNLPEPATFSLVAGNNTLMVPLNRSDLNMVSELGDEMAAGSVDQVFYWDAASQSFFGATDIGGFWDGDFELDIAMPLMAYSYDSITWPSRALQAPLGNSKVRN